MVATAKVSAALSSPLIASASVLFARLLLIGTATVNGILLPLALEQAFVGLFFVAQSLLVMLATIGQLGLNITSPAMISTAQGHRDRGRVRQVVVRTCLLATAWSAVLAIAILGFELLFGDAELVSGLAPLLDLSPIIAASLILVTLTTILSELYRALGHYIAAGFLLIGAGTGTSIYLLTAWLAELSVKLAWVLLAGWSGLAITLMIALPALLRRLRPYREPPEAPLSWRVLGAETLPNLATTSTLLALAQADIWLILLMGGSASQVAIYALGTRMAALVMVPLAMTNAVVYPSIGQLWTRKKTRYLQYILSASAAAATLLACLGYLAVLGIAWPLIREIWGDDYYGAFPIIVFLGLGHVIHAYTGAANYVLLMLNQQRQLMQITFWCGLFMLVGGAIAMATLGITGLAAVYGLGVTVQSCMARTRVQRLFGLDTGATLPALRKFINQQWHRIRRPRLRIP